MSASPAAASADGQLRQCPLRRLDEGLSEGKVLDRVASQEHLGKDHKASAGLSRLLAAGEHQFGVAGKIADGGVLLDQSDAPWTRRVLVGSHETTLATARSVSGYRRRVLRMLLTPRWVARFALLVVVVMACAWLGSWQWGRARVEVVRTPPMTVAVLTDIHEPGQPVNQDQIGRRVSLSGAFDTGQELLVVDRQDSGRPGVWVLTAFSVEGIDHAIVPVVRGWLPLGEDVPPAPEGEQRIVGWLEPTESDALRQRGRDPLPEGQVEIVSSAELLSLWEPPLFQGFVIQQQPEPEPPLVQVAPPSLTVEQSFDWQNAAYGIQWWLFGLFAIFWFVRMVRVEREDLDADPKVSTPGSLDTMEAPNQHAPRKAGND